MIKFTSEITRFSAQKFYDKKSIGFSPVQYSKFKFGCKDTARKFGEELAHKFCASDDFNELLKIARDTKCKIFVLSSPYVFIPTATFAMKDYFIKVFNHFLFLNDVSPCIEAKIYRQKSYKEEYGEMSAEERSNVLAGDIFHCDASLLNGNICIFLDDIVITGGHERRVLQMIEHYNMNITQYFLYYAQLTDQSINPNIENYLNYAFVKRLLDLNKIVMNDNFLMNTRVVKYILDAPHDECVNFLNYQRQSFLNTLYTYAIGNSYHQIPDYQMNFNYLRTKIDKI